jgi:hypothetical protein
MSMPESPRRRGDRIRQTILAWLFPLSGTLILLIAFVLALFAR